MAGEDARAAPHLNGAAIRERQVHVKNLRHFSSAVCISEEPTVDSDESTIWKFFQNLAGSEREQEIETIEILSGSGATCKCGAMKDGTQRLRDLCLCRGGWATITFGSPDGASEVTRRLDEHKRRHDGGAGPLGNRDDFGCVTFCIQCSLFQRQVQVSRERPPPLTEMEVEPDPGVAAMTVIHQDRLEAVFAILSGIIQGSYPRDIAALKNSVSGKLTVEAERGIRAGAENLIRRFCGCSDTVCEYFMANCIKEIGLLTPQEGLDTAYRVVDLLNDTQPGHSTTVRAELMLNIDIEARTALLTKLALAAKEGWTHASSPRRASPPGASHSTPDHGRDTSDQDQAWERQFTRSSHVLRVFLTNHPPDAYKDKSIGLVSLRSVKDRANRAFEELAGIYQDGRMRAQLEARYREQYQQLSLERDNLIQVLDDEIGKARPADDNSGGAAGWDEPAQEPSEHSTDLPPGEDIDHEVSMFTLQLRTIEKMEEQCGEVLNNENIAKMKHKFLNLQKTVCPSGTSILKDLGDTLKLFSKWLRVVSPDMTDERVSNLEDCVASARQMQIRWQKLLLLIRKTDRTYGFSQMSAAAGLAPPTPITVDTYWGEQDGKPFQNLVEWLAELEDRVLRHYPSHEDRVERALAHLAPGVVAILRNHKFSTYEKMRDWLLEYFLDKRKIMDDWVRQLNAVGSSNTRMTSDQVGLYVTQVRGILDQILEYSTTTAELRRRLFTTHTVAALGQTVLRPLKKPTGKDQWDEFVTTVYTRLKAEATEAKREVDPEVLLTEVVKRLEVIKKAQKAKADLNEEARLGGFRSTSGASDFERRMQHQIELLEQDGNVYEDIAATAASILCAGSSNPLPSSGTSKSATRRRRRGTGKHKGFDHVQVQVQAHNPGWGAEVLSYQITKGSKKSFIPEPSQVLVNQDSLAHAVAWQGQFKLRCWVCPNDQVGHEFANCETALAGPNRVRLQALRDPKQGPGHQCFSCLGATCFVMHLRFPLL